MYKSDINYLLKIEEFSENLNFNSYSSVILFVDHNTWKYCLPVIKDIIPGDTLILTLSDQEKDKNIENCLPVWEKLLSRPDIDRNSLFINLGGGIVSDTGGFIASTFKRGVQFINIPTTLLGMIDASVGGKTGVNFMNYKNQIGTFYEPSRILIFPPFLNSLDKENLTSGFAEIIKYALISDMNFWNEVQKLNPSTSNVDIEMIKKCIEIKLFYTEKDLTEKNIRKCLNFGHTIGHALETYYMTSENSTLLHGFAVANGMIAESMLSAKMSGLSLHHVDEITKYIFSIYNKINFPEADIDAMIDIMYRDKKNATRFINFSLLNEIGKCQIDVSVPTDILHETLLEFSKI